MKPRLTAMLSIIVLLGVAVSGYLAYVETLGNTPVCPIITGCATVAQSSYSYFMGIPVALFGFVAWLALLLCAYRLHLAKDTNTARYIFMIASVGILAAGYFNGVMLKIGSFCIWCEAAHVLMLLVFFIAAFLAFGSIAWQTVASFFVMFTLAFSFGIWNSTGTELASFAQCLAEKEVIMYGTIWCSHCKEQKELFGSAFAQVPYVECSDPANPESEIPACRAANIESYPTWVRAKDNARITGMQSITALATWTGCPNP